MSKFCTACGAERISDARYCGNCGASFSEAAKKKERSKRATAGGFARAWVIVGIATIIAVAAALYVWKFSDPDHDPGADRNRDGTITLDEARSELAKLPEVRRGKWRVTAVLEHYVGPDSEREDEERRTGWINENDTCEDWGRFYRLVFGSRDVDDLANGGGWPHSDLEIKRLVVTGNQIDFLFTLRQWSGDSNQDVIADIDGTFGAEAVDYYITGSSTQNEGKQHLNVGRRIQAVRIGDCP